VPTPDALKFKVAPHLVQDLGLNLYTSLGRVLVEFVANAYDADSPSVDIRMAFDQIDLQRKKMSADWKAECATIAAAGKASSDSVAALGERTLPPNVTIEIEDRGVGMSREDFQNRFLIAGRRRRDEDPPELRTHTAAKKRLLMGRKGVGKLAGFGVAHVVTVISRKQGDAYATKIVLDFNELKKKRSTDDIVVPEERIDGGAGLDPSGTRITLSALLHEPTQNKESTVSRTLGDHFVLIQQKDFSICLNEQQVKPSPREWDFAWPDPNLSPDTYVAHSYDAEDEGRRITFKYRIRFTKPGQMLPGKERGVRVYAHSRLASMPSLLNAGTNMHGFRMTDYMDGVVIADFLDDQSTDYIATDRQSLRWETPLLAPLQQYLSEQMKAACKACQNKRDKDAETEARKDKFTEKQIAAAGLPKHRAKALYKAAAAIAQICTDGVKGEEYQTRLPILIDGFAQGDLLTALNALSKSPHPNFNQVIEEITELTAQEFGDFSRYITGRLSGIDALDKIIQEQDFRKGKNEKELHTLLEKNPWIIDPTFTQFLTSNQQEDTVFGKLAQYLKLGKYAGNAPAMAAKKRKWDNDRPDLVFFLSSEGLARLAIVELKAPNIYLEMKHLLQLRAYMLKAKNWLDRRGKENIIVEGLLIGCHAVPETRTTGVMLLNNEIRKTGTNALERVYDLTEVLVQTRRAHQELLEIYKKAAKSA